MNDVRMRRYILPLLLTIACMRAAAQTDSGGYPPWMRDAVVYGIKPSTFVTNATYDDITRKIPDLQELGINTIWLQPVFRTGRGGQGYDITDFFALRDDLGSAAQLRTLIATAKGAGIRVLFDFVPNHTSTDHPYALDCIQKGKASPYYDYYQRQNDGAPYSSFYHTDENGFIYYFWKNLVNLNYNNEQVQQMIIDACKYWIKEFDIDGYRFDAVWAVNARAPQFGQRLRHALKSLKPDVLLLAEDKGSNDQVYNKGFDAAYDWTSDTAWVSQWSWEYKHEAKKSHTFFNHPDPARRKTLLSAVLFPNKTNNFRLLRYMENNDLPRFITFHSLQQTRMVAAIMFSLPGIPLLFNGQETGFRGHPYSRQATFDPSRSIRAQDSLGLFPYYKKLIRGRLQYDVLRGDTMQEIPVAAPAVIAYTRGAAADQIIVIANLDSTAVNVHIPGLPGAVNWYMDVVSGERIKLSKRKLALPGFTTLWLVSEKHWGKSNPL